MKTKKVSYLGIKAELPENVSVSTFKEVVAVCRGYNDVVQPIIDLISKKFHHFKKVR